MKIATLNIELYTEDNAYSAYISDNIGGSGISVSEDTPEKCSEKVSNYILDYFYNIE